jgi:hypothetical protein
MHEAFRKETGGEDEGQRTSGWRRGQSKQITKALESCVVQQARPYAIPVLLDKAAYR